MSSPGSGERLARPKGVVAAAIRAAISIALLLFGPPAVLLPLGGGIPDISAFPPLEEIGSSAWWRNWGTEALREAGLVVSWGLWAWVVLRLVLGAARMVRSRRRAAKPGKWAERLIAAMVAAAVAPVAVAEWLDDGNYEVVVTEREVVESVKYVVPLGGETFEQVAQRAGGGRTWSDIAEANPSHPKVRSALIEGGEVLAIPPSRTADMPAPPPAVPEIEDPLGDLGGEIPLAPGYLPPGGTTPEPASHPELGDDGLGPEPELGPEPPEAPPRGGWSTTAGWSAAAAATAGVAVAAKRMMDRRRKVSVNVAARAAAETLRVVAVTDSPEGVHVHSDRIAPPPEEGSGWVEGDDDLSWLLPRGAPEPLTSSGAADLLPLGPVGEKSIFYVNLETVSLLLSGPGQGEVRECFDRWSHRWENAPGDERTLWEAECSPGLSVFFPDQKLAVAVVPPPEDYERPVIEAPAPAVLAAEDAVGARINVVETAVGEGSDPGEPVAEVAVRGVVRELRGATEGEEPLPGAYREVAAVADESLVADMVRRAMDSYRAERAADEEEEAPEEADEAVGDIEGDEGAGEAAEGLDDVAGDIEGDEAAVEAVGGVGEDEGDYEAVGDIEVAEGAGGDYEGAGGDYEGAGEDEGDYYPERGYVWEDGAWREAREGEEGEFGEYEDEYEDEDEDEEAPDEGAVPEVPEEAGEAARGEGEVGEEDDEDSATGKEEAMAEDKKTPPRPRDERPEDEEPQKEPSAALRAYAESRRRLRRLLGKK